MVFKRKNYSTTTEILDLMKADDEIMRSTAVFYFHRKDKVSGKIYFRKGVEPGLVYAAHVSNMPFHIGKRIKPLIEEDEYEEILRQVGGDDTDPNIARLAISKQLVAEKTIDAFIREYLFSAASEIFSWQEVLGSWEIGTETQDFASRHYIGLDLLQKKAAARDVQYASLIAETRLSEDAIDTLKVLRKGNIEDFSDIENKNLQAIIEFADGRHTVADIREETGLLKIPAFFGIHALWNIGRLQLLAGDIPVYPPSTPEEEPEEEPAAEDVSEPIEFVSEESREQAGDISDENIEDGSDEYEADIEDEEYVDDEAPSVEVTDFPQPVSVPEEYYEDSSEEIPEMLEDIPEPIPEVADREETIKEEPAVEKASTSGITVFEKLYARIDELQKEVNNSDANIKESEMSVRSIDRKIKETEEHLATLKAERSQAVKNYHSVVSQGKDSKEKLEKIIASIDNLTAE